MTLRRRRALALLAPLAASLPAACARRAAGPAADPRLASNPALAGVYARDPEEALRILGELDSIVGAAPPGGGPRAAAEPDEVPDRQGRPAPPQDARGPAPSGRTRGGPRAAGPDAEDPRDRDLLERNPLLREAYRVDPRAATQQMRDILAAGGPRR